MTATTVPQIVPGTLTGDLDITSFTVEHYCRVMRSASQSAHRA